MRSFPTTYPDAPKACAACGKIVARRDCHKNRYDEYLCKTCRAGGIKFTQGARLRQKSKRVLWRAWLSVTVSGAVIMLVWAVYSIFAHTDAFQYFRPLFR